MTRFIHSSDWHLGASKFLGEDYLDRQLGVIDSIVDLAVARGIDTIVQAGDVFDVDEPDSREKEAFLDRVLAYDRMGIKLLCIRGNHDMSSMTGRTAIRYLAHMTDHGVFKHSVFAERTQYVRVGDTIFILLCHNPRYFKAEAEAAIAKLRTGSLIVPYKHLVLVCHEAIKGAVSDTNYRMTHGSDVPGLDVGEVTLDDPGLTYTAIGDIHIRQRVAPRTYYCGAPLQVKFGDQWPKGVLIVDTDNPDNPEFVPIPSKRLVRVEMKEGEAPSIPENAYVKLVASAAAVAEARQAGTITEDVVRFEAIKEQTALEYKETLDLQGRVLSGLSQLLTDAEDLDLGKREAVALFSAAGLA